MNPGDWYTWGVRLTWYRCTGIVGETIHHDRYVTLTAHRERDGTHRLQVMLKQAGLRVLPPGNPNMPPHIQKVSREVEQKEFLAAKEAALERLMKNVAQMRGIIAA